MAHNTMKDTHSVITHFAQSHLDSCQNTHTHTCTQSEQLLSNIVYCRVENGENEIKWGVFTGKGTQRDKAYGGKIKNGVYSVRNCTAKFFFFSNEAHWICYSCSQNAWAVTLLQKETDVLYLQMIGVNMLRAMQCVGGWAGRGMTIGFRERAMRTDGSWLPPKIPLRKMAGLTYFWTHHAVQIHCTERQAEYLHSEVIILSGSLEHYGIIYIVTTALMQQ